MNCPGVIARGMEIVEKMGPDKTLRDLFLHPNAAARAFLVSLSKQEKRELETAAAAECTPQKAKDFHAFDVV